MSLTIHPVFYATLPTTNYVVEWDHAIIQRKSEDYTPRQYGDLPNGKRDVQRQFRTRRWFTAHQTTCLSFGIEVWSRYVPCAQCGSALDAWQADVDHAVSRENGGRSEVSNMILIHPGCNRLWKGSANAHRSIVNALAAVAPDVEIFKGVPDARPTAGIRARTLADFWGRYPRLED